MRLHSLTARWSWDSFIQHCSAQMSSRPLCVSLHVLSVLTWVSFAKEPPNKNLQYRLLSSTCPWSGLDLVHGQSSYVCSLILTALGGRTAGWEKAEKQCIQYSLCVCVCSGVANPRTRVSHSVFTICLLFFN